MSQTEAPDGIPNALWSRMPEQTQALLSTLQDDSGVKKMMLRNVYGDDGTGEPTTSQAEIVADMFNIMRLDCKRLGEAAGVDISVNQMTAEGAAELLQGLVKGEDFGLIDRFNELEEKRERVLEALTDEEAVAEHQQVKLSVLNADVGEREDSADAAVAEGDEEGEDGDE